MSNLVLCQGQPQVDGHCQGCRHVLHLPKPTLGTKYRTFPLGYNRWSRQHRCLVRSDRKPPRVPLNSRIKLVGSWPKDPNLVLICDKSDIGKGMWTWIVPFSPLATSWRGKRFSGAWGCSDMRHLNGGGKVRGCRDRKGNGRRGAG